MIGDFGVDKARQARLQPNAFVDNMTLQWEVAFRALWPEDFRRAASAYREWAFVCTRVIADGVSSVPLRLYVARKDKSKKFALPTKSVSQKNLDNISKKTGLAARVAYASTVEEVIDHPFLDLMSRVNPFTNRFDLLDLLVINLELMGNAYIYKRRDTLGVTRELWNIPAQWMWVVPDPEEYIRGYMMQRLAYGQISSFYHWFDENEIIHFKYLDPNSPYYGISPLAACASAYNSHVSLDIYTNAAFQSLARPDGLITTEAQLSPENFERTKKMIQQQYMGVKNAQKLMFLDNGVKFTPTTWKPIDMGMKETRRDILERIAASFRVPLAKLITENVNKANAEQAHYDFLRDTVTPRLARIEEKLNEKLIPDYGEEYFVAFDHAIPEDRELAMTERASNIKVGLTTRNEERAKMGLPPLVAGGNSLPSLDVFGTGSVQDGELMPRTNEPIIPLDNPEEDPTGIVFEEEEAKKLAKKIAAREILKYAKNLDKI